MKVNATDWTETARDGGVTTMRHKTRRLVKFVEGGRTAETATADLDAAEQRDEPQPASKTSKRGRKAKPSPKE